MLHLDLFRHLLTVIDPTHLTAQDRVAVINLIGSCLAADKNKTAGGGYPLISPAR